MAEIKQTSVETKVEQDAVIGSAQQGIHRKIANAVGKTVDIGTDIAVDAGSIAAHTTGKGIRGLVNLTRSWIRGLRGKPYSQAA